MSREPLADLDDLADALRGAPDLSAKLASDAAEQARAERDLARASSKLRQKAPFDVDARLTLFKTAPADPAALDPVVVASVVANVVKRYWLNPNGTSTTTETIGPFTYAQNFVGRSDAQGQDVRGLLIILPSDIEELRARERTRGPRSITLHPTRSMNPISQWRPGPGYGINPATGLPDAGYEPEYSGEYGGYDPTFTPDPTVTLPGQR
jgi:hypothetical protein